MAITTIIGGTAGTTTITTMAITIIVATGTTGDCDAADEQACVTAGLFRLAMKPARLLHVIRAK
jgi:hypothetical protein